jgi:hypothetical protein
MRVVQYTLKVPDGKYGITCQLYQNIEVSMSATLTKERKITLLHIKHVATWLSAPSIYLIILPKLGFSMELYL